MSPLGDQKDMWLRRAGLGSTALDGFHIFVVNWVLLHTLNCQALTTDMFDLCSQIKYLPQPIQSHTNQIISRCMLCVHCEGCYGCLFLLNLLTRPRPRTLEEAWSEAWSVWGARRTELHT